MKSLCQPPISIPFHAFSPIKQLDTTRNRVSVTNAEIKTAMPKSVWFNRKKATLSALPASWINFVGPTDACIVERQGKYSKTLNFGIHFLNPWLEKITNKHSLEEQVIRIPLETVKKDDFEIEIEGKLYFKVVDPFLASYNGCEDPISEITQLVTRKLPIRNMIRSLLFNYEFEYAKHVYAKRIEEFEREVDNISLTFYEIERFGNHFFLRNCYYKIDEETNEATKTSWGIECLRFELDFCMQSEEPPSLGHVVVVYLNFVVHDIFGSLRRRPRAMELFKIMKKKADRILKSVEVLRDHFREDENGVVRDDPVYDHQDFIRGGVSNFLKKYDYWVTPIPIRYHETHDYSEIFE